MSEDAPARSSGEVPRAISVGSSRALLEHTVREPTSPRLHSRSLSLSPSSKKRALVDLLAEEPRSKRLRQCDYAPPEEKENSQSQDIEDQSPQPPATVDKEDWQGFCDIESDPAYFSVLLREMGVQGVTVREVFAMTPDLLDMLPQPIYGLILLYRYREFGKDDQVSDCPSNVWFANQLPAQNSCGTLAMINILMNNQNMCIGEHLAQFKDFTKDFTPFQRGEAFASFDFVKKIHNSFAKKMDMLESDRYLSYKVKRSKHEKGRKSDTKCAKTKRARAESKGKTADDDGLRRSNRHHSADSMATDDSGENYQDNAHHFIAFLPIGQDVWKLDGYDTRPTSIGSFDTSKGETWLSAVSDTIAALMAAGDNEYGVIALAQSPLVALRQEACEAIHCINYIEARLDFLSSDWKSFLISDEPLPTLRMLGIENHVSVPPLSEGIKANVADESVSDLLDRRNRVREKLLKLAGSILDEIQTEAEEQQKAAQRRFDGGPVIKKWLEMLAENGHLEQNLDRFMPGSMRKNGK